MPTNNPRPKIQTLKNERLRLVGEKGAITTTDAPISDDVRETIASVLLKSLRRAKS